MVTDNPNVARKEGHFVSLEITKEQAANLQARLLGEFRSHASQLASAHPGLAKWHLMRQCFGLLPSIIECITDEGTRAAASSAVSELCDALDHAKL